MFYVSIFSYLSLTILPLQVLAEQKCFKAISEKCQQHSLPEFYPQHSSSSMSEGLGGCLERIQNLL